MAIFITNTIYLVAGSTPGYIANRPLIGWHSVAEPGDFTSGTVIPEYPASAVWSADTYTKWRSPASGLTTVAQSLYINISVDSDIDYIGIAGHNMAENGISYQLLSSADGAVWSGCFPARVPTDNRPIMEHFNATSHTMFRLEFVIPALTEGVSIAHIKIGRILQLERPSWGGMIPGGMDVKTESIGSKSYSGNYLGTVLVSQGEAYKIDQKNNTAGFIRSDAMQNFFKHSIQLIKLANGPVESFFYAWRPDTHPTEIQYCAQHTEFSAPSNSTGTQSGGLMAWSMSGSAFR